MDIANTKPLNPLRKPLALSLALHALLAVAVLIGFAEQQPRLLALDSEGIIHVSFASLQASGTAQSAKPAAAPKKERARETVPEKRALEPERKVEGPAISENRVELASLYPQETKSDAAGMVYSGRRSGDSGAASASGAVSANAGSQQSGGGGTGVTLAVPRYRENPNPQYPETARMRGYEGLVLLSAEVSAEGRVEDVSVKKSCGYALLDRSALDAVRRWKFDPGRRMGVPVTMRVDVPVRFMLKE